MQYIQREECFEKNKEIASDLWNREWADLIPSYTLCFSEINRPKTATCDFTNNKIILSHDFLNSKGCDIVQIKLVFAHEVAHALMPENFDTHSDAWKQKSIELGGNGRIQDCISSYHVENHYFFSRVHNILETIPQDQEISKEIQISAQKKVLGELIDEGHDPTELLKMYMEESSF